MKCNNCSTEFASDTEGLLLKEAGTPVTAVCGGCVSGVKKLKLVVTRQSDGTFTYEQYSALEMVKKTFGKSA